MAFGKAAMVFLLTAVLVAAASAQQVATSYDDPASCYCPCMKDQCMRIDKATKEECASACDKGCREAGAGGQPNPLEFCGF
ncbi:hypothetical protein MUK42_19529 [Musa troglodytarum]|uniref:Bowman-Birk serine protease inhibitors family domain-containing protein n=3 Tax=Musa troglodytarum TaxID=320322 RepID=A0A9E7FXL0_9LILI|nr:hypothetical protein MUK42_19529 [Musa troglodytarum]